MAFSYTDIKNALELASKKTGGKFLSFDASDYQAHYAEVRDAGGVLLDDSLKNYAGDPLQHYVEIGAAKGYAPNAHFDAAFYKSQYADLAPYSGADLLAHYALFGAYEGRAPTAILQAFDGARYLKDYPDVAAYVNANLADFLGSVTNGAIAHYVLFGASEQRTGYTTSGLYVVSNHAPTTHDTSLTLNKGVSSLVLKASDFPFTDVDSGDSLKAIVISTTPDNGVLKLNGALVLSGSNTQVSLQQLNEGKLVFSPPPLGWEGLSTFEFKVLDQADASATGKVQVAVGNVAPTTQAAQVSIEKNQAYTFKTADFPFSDANGDALGGVVVKSLPGLGTLKLNGTNVTVGKTIAAADLVGGKLVYTPDVDYNGQQSFGFQVKDAALASDAAVMTLVVGNRPPTTGAASVSLAEDASYTFKRADFPFSDADGNTLAKLELSSLPVDGQLRLNGVAQAAGAQIGATDLDAGKLTYVPAANVNGSRSFDFKVWDQQAASSTAKMTLTVTPVNDAPTTAAARAVMAADTAYVFKAADFPFSDVDAGDSLQAVVLGSLPGNGVLSLDGAAVTGGTVVTAAQLGAGLLRYTPTTGFNGKTSFDFRVKDAALESGSASFALSVGNQAPVTQNAQLAVPDLAYVFKAGDFPFSDENPEDALQAVVIGSLPANGALKLDGSALKIGDVVSRAQLDAGKLAYSTATAFTGQVSFGFQVKDVALSSNSATMTLKVGDQTSGMPALSIKAQYPTFNEGSGGGALPVPLDITRSSGTGVSTVQWTVVTGTADVSDFIGDTFGSVTFAAGETSKTITLQVNKDSNAEANETFSVQLKNPVNATLATGSASETILNDDDTSGLPSLSIRAIFPAITEGSGGGTTPVPLEITRDISTGITTISWGVVFGTADNNDFSGSTNGSVTFAAGETSKIIQIQVNKDDYFEADESFNVELIVPRGPRGQPIDDVVRLAIGSANETILNDEPQPASTFQFKPLNKPAQASEGTGTGNEGSLSYDVLRTGDLQAAGSVKWRVVPAGADPAEADDFLDQHYPSGTLQFAANESLKSIVVTFQPDDLKGGNETFSIQLSDAVNGIVSSQAASMGGTILDDDTSKNSGPKEAAFEGDHLYALQFGANEVGWGHGAMDGGWLL